MPSLALPAGNSRSSRRRPRAGCAVSSRIPGLIDPAANGRSQIDGQQLFQIYRNLGLKLQSARNAREAGIYAVWMRLSTGKLKVFRSRKNWFDEFRIFCRDENGNIIGESKFHLMASTRYLFLGSMNRWIVKPIPKEERDLGLRETVINIGPPTTLHQWGLSVTLPDGEVATGKINYQPVHARAGDLNIPIGDIEVSDFLQLKTERNPIVTGGSESGVLILMFPGYKRDNIDFPGNDVLLTFEDASGGKYKFHKKMIALTEINPTQINPPSVPSSHVNWTGLEK